MLPEDISQNSLGLELATHHISVYVGNNLDEQKLCFGKILPPNQIRTCLPRKFVLYTITLCIKEKQNGETPPPDTDPQTELRADANANAFI